MIKLDKGAYSEALELYRSHIAFFPLIAAVLLDKQNGVVFADSASNLQAVYTEHSFGFSQIYGRPIPKFETALKQYLVQDRSFFATKVRLYTPCLPEFLRSLDYTQMRSERQRFILDWAGSVFIDRKQATSECTIKLTGVNRNTAAIINSRFGVINRFWRTSEDFIALAHPVVAWIDHNPVAICYAAAIADGYAEIDVTTLPEYRNLGLGKLIVNRFAQDCLSHGLQPVWDCFTNNAESMALCRSSGFVPLSAPYPFFTIHK